MTSPAADGQRTIALAAVAGAHGITGELRLKLFANDLASLTKGATMLVGGAPMKLLGIKGTVKAPIARFEGIPDRTAAEKYRGRDRKSTRLNSSHSEISRMPSSA